MHTTNLTLPLATFAHIATDIVKPGADVEALHETARGLRTKCIEVATRAFSEDYTRAQAEAALAEYDVKVKSTAKVATVIERLAQEFVKASVDNHQSWKTIRETESARQSQAWTVDSAWNALADWSMHENNGHLTDYSGGQMNAVALDYLKQIADAALVYAVGIDAGEYGVDEARAAKDEPLKALVSWINNTSFFHYDSDMSHVSQSRIGDVVNHLAKMATAKYALEIIAPAALGIEGARVLGIAQGYYR